MFSASWRFIPFVGMYCACRLAKPHSIWAHKRYAKPTSRAQHRLERAEHRWRPDRRTERFGRKLQDWIAGTPTPELAAEGKQADGKPEPVATPAAPGAPTAPPDRD